MVQTQPRAGYKPTTTDGLSVLDLHVGMKLVYTGTTEPLPIESVHPGMDVHGNPWGGYVNVRRSSFGIVHIGAFSLPCYGAQQEVR